MLTPEQIKKIRTDAGLSPEIPTRPAVSQDIINQRLQKFDAAITQGKDDRSAQSNSALFPAKTGEGPIAAGKKAIGNVASSVFNLGKGAVDAVIHPIRTGEGIINTVKGAGEALGRTLIEKTAFGDIKTSTGATLKENIVKIKPDISEQTYNAVVDSLHDRYGSLENAQRTATNDPFGFGADVMAVLSGGAGLTRKVAPVTAETAGRVAESVTQPLKDLNTAVREKIGTKFQESAQNTMSKVLNPTKEPFKTQTQQILPELTSRKKVAFSQKGLAGKFDAEAEAAGQAIDEAWQALPPGSREKVTPIVDALEQSKNNFIVEGKIIEPEAWKAADDLQKIILDVSKNQDTIPSESLRKVRQIWDKTIAESKGFTRDLSDQSKLAIKRQATDAIRTVLSEAHPEIDKLNQEYTLWRKASDIIEETIKRKTGKGAELGDKVLAAGGIGGGSATAGLKGAVIGAGAVAAITLATKSTLWKTLSATAKTRIAEAIIEANPTKLSKVLRPLIGDQALTILNDAQE